MIDSLYGDLPPPQFGDEDNSKPTIFINDAIKPLLKPIQTVTCTNTNKLNSNNQSIQQLQNYQPNQHNNVSLITKTISSTEVSNTFTNVTDDEEYNPAYPNSYDQYINEIEIKRKILENKSIPKSEIDLNVTGEEAWKRRAKMSDPTSLPINNDFTVGNKKNLATRLMEKMGWKAGEGLGKDKQGIKAPLIAKKVAQNSAIITIQDPIFNPNAKIKTSRILCIKSSDILPLDMVEDEASKHGSLISIKSHNSNDNRIFLEFETESQGANCYKNMNKSTMNGKFLSMYYYPVNEFTNNNFDCTLI